MAGQPVRIGPFVGGLNNISTAGESKDEEVVNLVNFDLSLGTSLISRPPMQIIKSSREVRRWETLGIFRITAAEWYVIVQEPTGADYKIRAYLSGDFATTPLEIKTVTPGNEITGYVQYNNYGYFLVGPGASIACFRWTKNTANDIATMPKGTVLVSWKDRLWVTGSGSAINGNYVWFSTVDATGPKPDMWTIATDFYNVDPGSGGLNTSMLPLTSTLLIFKEDATYRFAFSRSPKDGEIVNLSRQIGAAGPNSTVGFENYAFVYDQGRIYELINSKFTQINLGVDFSKNAGINIDAVAPNVDISVVGRRLIVRYFTSLYVYSVDTRTWTQWQSHAGTPGKFIELPGDSSSAAPIIFLAASRGTLQLSGDNKIEDPDFRDIELNTARTAFKTGTGTVVIDNTGIAKFSNSYLTETYIYLTETGTALADIPVSASQCLSFSVDVTSTGIGAKVFLKLTFLKFNGTTEELKVERVVTSGNYDFGDLIVPANSYMVQVQLGFQGAVIGGQLVNVSNPIMLRNPAKSSATSVIKFIDGYLNTTPIELIECEVKTKAFDYQAGAVFKRLFLWGIDVVTPRSIVLKAFPLGRKASVTWDVAAGYTWDQLAQGTWDNPLSWKGVTKTITDVTDPFTDISENGRFFVKAPKSLKFRQIQYYVRLTTLGNLETGPAKLFSMTTFTKAGQMVVDKAT